MFTANRIGSTGTLRDKFPIKDKFPSKDSKVIVKDNRESYYFRYNLAKQNHCCKMEWQNCCEHSLQIISL